MSLLRTYRVLPLLVGLALLFGAASPAVQAACAMMPGGAQEASMPCHRHGEGEPVLNTHKDRVGVSCGADPSENYHLCCHPDGAVPSSATMLSEAGPRVFAPALASGLQDGAQRAALQRSVLLSAGARGPSFSFTSTTLRQALLATFLI